LLIFIPLFLLNFPLPLKLFKLIGGGEYTSNRLKLFLLNKGISHRLSYLYTPEQNGVAERKHRHIIETTITLLQTAKLPSKFWSYACQTATYLINRMPTIVLHNSSPFEMLLGSSPTITHF